MRQITCDPAPCSLHILGLKYPLGGKTLSALSRITKGIGATALCIALTACSGGGLFGFGGSTQADATRQAVRTRGAESVAVNRYLWAASIDVLNFLPIQSVDPFTGVIVMGFGTPPGQPVGSGISELSVPACRECVELIDDFCWRFREVTCRNSSDVDRTPSEVALDVFAVAARAEEHGTLTANLKNLVEQCAAVILAADVTLAVRNVGAIAARDVGDAVAGPTDRGLERRRNERGRGGGSG